MNNTFGIKEAISTGYDIFKEKWQFLVLLGIIIGLLNIAGGVLQIIPILGPLLSAALQIFIGIGATIILFKIYDRKDTNYKDLFSGGKYFWVYIGAGIIAAFITIGGYILLVVPGIIAALALMFVKLIVIDRNARVFEAIRTSWAITEGNRFKLFLLMLVLVLLNFIGFIALIFGLLVTVPITALAIIHVYRLLLAQAEKAGKLPVEKLQTTPQVFMWLGIVIIPLMIMATLVFSVFVASLDSARAKSRDIMRTQNLKQLQLADEMYFDANGKYAASLKDLKEGGLINDIPTDPSTHTPYEYKVGGDGQSYTICANDAEDSQGPICVSSDDLDSMNY